MSVKLEDVDALMELADQNGVACTSVEDGHVLVFTKRQIELILECINAAGQDKCVVFVQRPEAPPGPLN